MFKIGYKDKTSMLIMTGLFIAISIIMTRFLSINTPTLRIGFGFIPIALLGILYGPILAAISAVVADILGSLLWPPPTGIFPGFTVTAGLTGLVFGLFLYKKAADKKGFVLNFVASVIVVVVLNLLLDSYWLTIIYKQGYFALLPTRILKTIVQGAVYIVLIPLLHKSVLEPLFPELKRKKIS